MINVKVKYISGIEEHTGVLEESLQVNDGITVSELIKLITEKYLKLREFLSDGDLMVGVNGRIVTNYNVILTDGDVVILSRTIAGG